MLWPEHPIGVVVSLGVGLAPAVRREKGLSSFMETGSILIESRWVRVLLLRAGTSKIPMWFRPETGRHSLYLAGCSVQVTRLGFVGFYWKRQHCAESRQICIAWMGHCNIPTCQPGCLPAAAPM